MNIFVDISSLLSHVKRFDKYTGIQRVVTEILASLSIDTPDNIFVCFVEKRSGTIRCLPLAMLKPECFLSPVLLRSAFFRLPKISLKRFFLDRWSRQQRGKEFVTAEGNASWMYLRNKAIAIDQKMVEGDKLLLLDSSWTPRDTVAFSSAKKKGVQVLVVIYDLIPLILPGTTADQMPRRFYDWLRSSVTYCDSYICISESTKSDLLRFLAGQSTCKKVDVLRLAQAPFKDGSSKTTREKNPASDPVMQGTDDVSDLFDVDPTIRSLTVHRFVLCVGTREARKNLWRVALAWKYLIDQGKVDIPRLVIAGRPGWHIEPLNDLLRATGNLFGFATVLDNPSDREIEFLVKRCEFTVMASIYEGWGLPVGESLAYGKTGVVSNVSSLPEVGQDCVAYCDPSSVLSIAMTILRLVEDEPYRKALEERIRDAQFRSWQDVASDLLKIVNCAGFAGGSNS